MNECSIGTCAFNRQCVQGTGPMDARIMLIGEAPGMVELCEGRPFVGPSGRLLDTILLRCGLARQQLYVTNTCGCVDLEREDRRPLPNELDACRPRLMAELGLVNPIVAVCIGGTATQLWFPGERIGQVYGTMRAVGELIVIPTYHPAHVLRGNRQVEPIIEEAFKQARRFAYAD